ncbi:MAG: hypothetical protein M0Z66_14415 [Thermaerobacter sp.]|nr:hypothetical protein [Thermaerobacter sp.]
MTPLTPIGLLLLFTGLLLALGVYAALMVLLYFGPGRTRLFAHLSLPPNHSTVAGRVQNLHVIRPVREMAEPERFAATPHVVAPERRR